MPKTFSLEVDGKLDHSENVMKDGLEFNEKLNLSNMMLGNFKNNSRKSFLWVSDLKLDQTSQ